jgi:DNA-binding transcriptional regulator YhcF (GntR family)
MSWPTRGVVREFSKMPDSGSPVATSNQKQEKRVFRRASATFDSDDIVRQIEEAISYGRLQVGDRLPTQRQLSEIFGASRFTVRRAMHILEKAGLVGIYRGRTGGVFITAVCSKRTAWNLNHAEYHTASVLAELEEALKAIREGRIGEAEGLLLEAMHCLDPESPWNIGR